MIKFIKKISIQKILILIMLSFILGLVGCSGGGEQVVGEYTVIYDGNGGYLGNKTYTFRKLQVSENSKIPKYLSEYTQDQYVVSSLGLATRDGYYLKGWYLAENAQYAPNPSGQYVYLDLESGNGYYEIAEQGEYVYGYIQDENGKLIYIYVQENISEDDETPVEYIFYNGGSGLGFYIYDSEDPDQIEIYENDGSYSADQVSKYGTYLLYDELTEAEKVLFDTIPRYNQLYRPYTDEDEGLLRYDLVSGYVHYDTLFELNQNGDYVLVAGEHIIYDAENVEHADLDRYSLASRYVFTPTLEVDIPAKLDHFNAEMTYWDFEKDRITKDITLLAHWEKKLTVYYVQKSGQVTQITTKQNETNTAAINLVAGETIGKLETIPLYAGYTFIAWSTSETEYIPWDFNNDVFPLDQSELYLYAYMIEGIYTRITSANGLSKVALDRSGKYVLVNDIDLEGQVFYNMSPLGLEVSSSITAVPDPFTGEFISFGFKIHNFTLNVKNLQKKINEDLNIVVVSALFPYTQNATIRNIVVDNVKVILETAANSLSVVSPIGGAGVVGTALEGTTIIDNVTVSNFTFLAKSLDVINKPVYIGEIIAIGSEYTTITNCSSTIDYSAITNITTSDLIIVTLN